MIRRVKIMDPFTFGMVSTGALGGGLLLVTTLEKRGVQINDTAIKIVMEIVKAGGLLYLIKHIWTLFM